MSTVPVRLDIIPYQEEIRKDFNYQIVFFGLKDELYKQGHEITKAERRIAGRGSDIAIRVRLKEI